MVYSSMAHFLSRLCLFTADSCSFSTSRALSSPARLLLFVRGQRTTPAQTKGFHSQRGNSEFIFNPPCSGKLLLPYMLPFLPLLNTTCLLLTDKGHCQLDTSNRAAMLCHELKCITTSHNYMDTAPNGFFSCDAQDNIPKQQK